MKTKYTPEYSTLLEVSGVSYALLKQDDETLTYARLDAPDDLRVFTHQEFGATLRKPNVRLRQLALSPGRRAAIARTGVNYVQTMPAASQAKTLWKELWVIAALTAIDEGRANYTEASLAVIIPELDTEIEKKTNLTTKAKRAGQPRPISPRPPCPRTLLQWMREYKRAGRSALALARKKGSGRFASQFCEETNRLLNSCIITAINMQRLDISEAYKDCRDVFAAENNERRAAGMSMLHLPSLSTFRRRIGRMNAYERHTRQHGRQSARRKFRLFENGLDILRVGQRTEIDSYLTDVFTLLSWWRGGDISPEDAKNLKAIRIWITVVIDCATRCILGFKLTLNPSPETAVRVISQIGKDKTDIARSAGCETPWSQFCGVSEIAADNGAEFISPLFQSAVTDLGWTMTNTVAAMPELRGTIERLFRTVGSKLLAHLSGRAFSNIVERGDYSSEALAALNEDELSQIFLLFFVDIYHNEPHEGLRGETPANAWVRISKEMGKIPEPDPVTALGVFGLPIVRKLGPGGVEFSGIRYTNDLLREQFLRTGGGQIFLRVDVEDMGWVAVLVGDEWHPAFAVNPAVRGMSYIAWRDLILEERSRNRQLSQIVEPTIIAARNKIKNINSNAMARENVSLPLVTAELLQLDQQRLFIGLSIRGDATEAISVDETDADIFGDVIGSPDFHPLPSGAVLPQPVKEDANCFIDETEKPRGGNYLWPDEEDK